MSLYSREVVERLLPTVWDEEAAFGIVNPYAPADDMPKGTINPAEGGVLFAQLADIRQAWKRADVPLVERQALLLRFGLGYTQKEIAMCDSVTQQAAQYRIERGVGRITAHLNGERYVTGYDANECESETDDW